MSFSDFRLKVAKRILETIIEKHLSPVRSMLIINSSYTFYSSNKNTFAKNNYYPRAIYEKKKTHQFVYIPCLSLYRYK